MRKLNTIPGYYQVSDCYVITNEGKLINSKTNRQVKVKDSGSSSWFKNNLLTFFSSTAIKSTQGFLRQ